MKTLNCTTLHLPVVILFIISAAFLASCTQEAPTSSSLGRIILHKNDGFVVPQVEFNSQNPYDSLGVRHNEAIIYAFNHVNDSSISLTYLADTLCARVVEYYALRGYFANEQQALDCIDSSVAFCEAWQDTLEDVSKLEYYINPQLREIEVGYIRRIGHVLDEGGSTTLVRDSLQVIENDIINTTWLSGEYLALKCISVAKYSTELWNSISEQAENNGLPPLSPEVKNKLGIADVITIIIKDEQTGADLEVQIPIDSLWEAVKWAGNTLWTAVKAVGNFLASLWPW